MGIVCSLVGKNRTIEIKINILSKRMTSYYCLQKKIENIFESDKSSINDYGYSSFYLDKPEKFYILDYDWIRTWKENSCYSYIKDSLDKIYSFPNNNIIKDLQTQCQILENEGKIINVEFPFTNDTISYNLFISNNNFKLKDFDCLLDKETYLLFKKMSIWNYFFRKELTLEGIISKRIIILFVDQMQTVKFIYKGKTQRKDNELIQLTANCLELDENSGEFNMKESLLKYDVFKNFLLNKNDQEIIDIFENEGIGLLEEKEFTFNNYQITIKNETFLSKSRSSIKFPKKPINFQNILNFRKIGLDNVGATCYMNATLQCFMNINSLTNYLLTEEIYNQIEKSDDTMSLSKAYCHLLEKVWLDNEVINSYAPYEFKNVISEKNPLFKGVNANDSKDLINFLLENMNVDLKLLNNSGATSYKQDFMMLNPTDMLQNLEYFRNGFSKNNNSIIAHNFFFIMQTNTLCSGCNSLKYNFQALFIMEFPLELVYKYCLEKNIPSINSQGKKCISLLSCFEHYEQPTQFEGENMLYCNYCKGQKIAISNNYLFSLPPVLAIILNRGKGKSFDCDVNFPEYLNLENFVVYKKSICNYRLKGVISHLGESNMSGHFIAYCRHRVDDNWYLFNDSTVTLCDSQKKDFMVGTAYILFYESVNNFNNTLFDNIIEPNYIIDTTNGISNNNFNHNINMNMNCFGNVSNNFNNNMNEMQFNIGMGNNIINNFIRDNNMNLNNFNNNMNGMNNNIIINNDMNINNNNFNNFNSLNNIDNNNNNFNNIDQNNNFNDINQNNNFNNFNQNNNFNNNNNINDINQNNNFNNNNFNDINQNNNFNNINQNINFNNINQNINFNNINQINNFNNTDNNINSNNNQNNNLNNIDNNINSNNNQNNNFNNIDNNINSNNNQNNNFNNIDNNINSNNNQNHIFNNINQNNILNNIDNNINLNNINKPNNNFNNINQNNILNNIDNNINLNNINNPNNNFNNINQNNNFNSDNIRNMNMNNNMGQIMNNSNLIENNMNSRNDNINSNSFNNFQNTNNIQINNNNFDNVNFKSKNIMNNDISNSNNNFNMNNIGNIGNSYFANKNKNNFK